MVLQQWLYVSSIFYCPAAYFTKFTILLLMEHVLSVEERVARGIYIFVWALLDCYIPIQVIKILTCIAIWDGPTIGVHEGTQYLDQRKVFPSNLSLVILSDFVILIVPLLG